MVHPPRRGFTAILNQEARTLANFYKMWLSIRGKVAGKFGKGCDCNTCDLSRRPHWNMFGTPLHRKLLQMNCCTPNGGRNAMVVRSLRTIAPHEQLHELPSAQKRLQMKIWRFYFAFAFAMERQIKSPRFSFRFRFRNDHVGHAQATTAGLTYEIS